MKRIVALSLCLSLASASASMPAFAQAPADVAAARKKFDLALDLEKKGEWKAALTLLRDVAAVKATSQVRFHIALCLERTGKLVAARDEYVRAKEEAETKEGAEGITMQKKSVERIADLDARIPKLEFVLPEDVVSAKLSIDGGEPIPIAVKPIVPIDPGDHQLVVTSTGRKTWKLKLTVKEKDPQKKIDVKLESGTDEEPAAPEKEPEGEPEPAAAKTPAPPPPPVQRPKDWNRYALPMVLGGVGGVALVTATVMYAMRGSNISEMDSACGPNRDHCPSNVHSLEDRGHTYTTVGNVLL
ncbi:MAG: tetratricopeptide repeat protein, partial [Polyangiales bacterium]